MRPGQRPRDRVAIEPPRRKHQIVVAQSALQPAFQFLFVCAYSAIVDAEMADRIGADRQLG